MDVLSARGPASAAAAWAVASAALFLSAGAFRFRAPAMSPERAQAVLADLEERQREGRLPEALCLSRRLLRSFPEDPVYWRRAAEVYHALEDYESESGAYEQAMRLSPTPADNCPAIGRAYLKRGLAEKALDADRRCLEAAPDNADMKLYYALGLEHAGRRDEARPAYEAVLKAAPDYADAVIGLARLDRADGRPEAARARLRAASARYPKSQQLRDALREAQSW